MDRFYGRKNELGKVAQSFTQVRKGGAGAVLVSGSAGTGKTALVNRFGVEAETAGALFVYSKSDNLRRSAPFSTLAAAMDIMVKKVIAENPGGRPELKDAIRQGLGRDLGPLPALLSALAYIFETETAKNHRTEITDNQSVNLRLLSLLEALAGLRRPLVLFLDDLQWMDAASHGFLRYLAINGLVPCTLLVMAFRNEDPESSGNLEQTTLLYQNQETTLCLALSGLTRRDTKGFLKQRLDADQNLTPLADICYRKTAGNPFYLTQLVDELLEKKVICRNNGEWIYDISYISSLGFTENVVGLIIKRLRLLEIDCLVLLKQAACIQADISIPLLEATSGFSREKIETLLWKPVQLDLLHEKPDGFVFAHDRIMEAVKDLLTDREAHDIHRRLVAFFLAQDRPGELKVHIFTILYHYGFYCHTVKDAAVRKEMAGFYFQAGELAHGRSAYGLALEYLTQGKAHFPGDIWDDDYELALEFCHHISECAYLAGDFSTADRIFTEVEARAKSFSHRLAVEMVKIPCYQAQKKAEKALEAGLAILSHLRIRIPKNPSGPAILYAISKAWARFVLSRKDRLKQKKMVPDTDVYKAVKCLNALGSVVFYLSPQQLMPLMAAITFNLILKHGSMEEAPVSYIVFGMILNEITGTVKWGRKLGAMAREISLGFSDDRLKTKEMTLTNVSLNHWDKSLAQGIRDFVKTEKFCLRQSDHEYFTYNALGRLYGMMISYIPLDTVLQKIDEKKKVLERLNNQLALTTTSFMQQTITNLEKGVRQPWVLTGDHFDEARLDDGISGIIVDFYLYKFCAAFYCGRTDIAADIKRNLAVHNEMAMDAYQYYYVQFLSALVDINLKSGTKKINRHLKRLKKYSSYNVAIYGNKYLLALGDSLRLKGDPGAEAVYLDAATAAEKKGFRFEQALAFEGLALIAKNNGDDAAAQAHFAQAVRLCKQWGLKWRQGLFENEMEGCHAPQKAKNRLESPTSDPTDGQTDLDTQNKKPSTEQIVDDILRTMKRISGAAVIHTVSQETQCWKSRVFIDDNGIHRPATFVPLPEKMLSFACVTGEVIQIDSDSIEEQLFDTVYFWKHRPSSLMVIPGKEQNGIYIENCDNTPDIETLARLADEILVHFRPNPAASSHAGDFNTTDNQHLRAQCRKLQEHMAKKRSYQKPSLSITCLAKEVRMPQRAIADAIKACLDQNFHAFVNSYRVEAVKQALSDSGNKDKTILEIAFANGFNSKSTFNVVFKESVGTTPSKFRAGPSAR